MTNLIMEEKKPLFNIYFDGKYSLLQKMTDKWRDKRGGGVQNVKGGSLY